MKMSTQQFILALIVMSLLILDILILAFVEIPKANESTFNLFLGTQLGVVGTVASFVFPSNVSSASKDHTIATLAAKANPVDTTTQTTTTETVSTTAAPTTAAPNQGAEDNGRARPV